MAAYIRSQSVVSRVIAGETLIIPIRKGVSDLASIYSLNRVASLIWHFVEQSRTSNEIIQAIEVEFSSEGEPVRKEVEDFLAEMCSLGLILPLATGAAA